MKNAANENIPYDNNYYVGGLLVVDSLNIYTFPVKYDLHGGTMESGKKYYMGVMLQRDSQSQRLYLHDVIIEKEIEISTEEHLNTEQGRPRNDNLSMTSILKKSLNVNTNSRMILENLQNDTDIRYMLDEDNFDENGNHAKPKVEKLATSCEF